MNNSKSSFAFPDSSEKDLGKTWLLFECKGHQGKYYLFGPSLIQVTSFHLRPIERSKQKATGSHRDSPILRDADECLWEMPLWFLSIWAGASFTHIRLLCDKRASPNNTHAPFRFRKNIIWENGVCWCLMGEQTIMT